MKKSILAVAGVAAFAGVALPFGGAYAEDPLLTDSLSIQISKSCTLGYDSTTPHSGGTGSVAPGTWSSNTLSATIANNKADTAVGTTKMTISCNNIGGYDLTLDSEALTGGTTSETIGYITSNAAPTAGTSSWGVSNGTAWVLDNGKVATSSSAASGASVTVTYGVATSATQAADTYTGDAIYTLTNPASS